MMITCSAVLDANMGRAISPYNPKPYVPFYPGRKGSSIGHTSAGSAPELYDVKHLLIKGRGQKNVVSQQQYGTCTKCQEIKVKNSDGCPLGGIR